MLDYTGIVVLTVGSFYPCVYYGFYCDPYLQTAYLFSITVAGIGAAYVVLSPGYSTPAYRWARTTVFLALGLTAIVPVLHGLRLYGFSRLRQEMGLLWLLGSGVLYVTGALIYASRMPERWHPGRFDYFGASHQIFHVCVVLAALCHYQCISTAFEHRHGLQKGLCDILQP
ncbi:ADIPOR-like receptor SPBC12C2,09c OS=Schizosaccharomyces pombe (strain 972 / ATCC 24843) GN=SPBC12C2.09c PE=3 SV=1 [Rhizoctonia solani AG-1 IB]|uniref:ADIPOR-like receptor SPBC12C2,09c n=1 Tax=Thanatephorus cucumeris (strain AG1-IB / isolate 7/3/14) TaxID=1108050 RepID=A0A0B7F3X3_THACB|nr:ADIPOR-like receptor SPBC12C2,09c OS=Schizosaccharomyces pombe (strain 972 / ATCC 24843) GN=SPBC12C2.09c PE=3 SV=1 [Rhizoctonia solani AG-1 IB]